MRGFISPGDPASLLSVDRRRRERDVLANGQVVDVVVIGGGATGTGVALDAATRGLSVALVESADLANGTSRWSSKLIHGGLRYLTHGRVDVAWESAIERARLMTVIAPHLISAVPQLIPIFAETSREEQLTVAAGLRAGDLLRRATRVPTARLPQPRHVSADEALRLAPGLAADRLRRADIGWDGQLEDDARLVVAIARTAAAFGAKILTYASAESIGPGGVVVHDQLDGGTFTINARHVVNATGVWASTLDSRTKLAPSRGSHVVLRSTELGNPAAAITVPVPGERGRYVFALPQPDDLVFVGLTDVAVAGPVPASAAAPTEDIEWILDVLSPALSEPINSSRAIGSFVGFRPLPATDSGTASADLSRQHVIQGRACDVITVTGGKLTTYRRMAQDVVDRITDVECRTAALPLVGAGPVWAPKRIPRRLVRRFGSEAPLVASLAETDPTLLDRLGTNVAVLGVELLWGLLAEGATGIEDLLERRTRVSLVPADLADITQRALAITDASAQVRFADANDSARTVA